MDLERKKFSRFDPPPLKRSKPRTQRYEIFVARRGFEKKKSFQIGPQRYQNDRKSIGNNIGGGFGPQKSAWTKLWAEKGSKRVIFRVLGSKKGRPRSKIFVAAQFPGGGEKIFENFFHKKNIRDHFRVREKKISGIAPTSSDIMRTHTATPERGGGAGGVFRFSTRNFLK